MRDGDDKTGLMICGEVVGGMQGGKAAALLDWRHKREARDFEKLIKTLRAVKWNREHKERRAEISAKHYAKPETKAAQRERQREARRAKHRETPAVFTCAECGATWCKAPWVRGGPAPRFCGSACFQRARYQATTPGARRIKRHGAAA